MQKFRCLAVVILVFFAGRVAAQTTVFSPTIKTARLYKTSDPTAFPVITLGAGEQLQLEFDDLDKRVKNFYYSFQLRNADWSPTLLTPFEYISGFQSSRLTTYRNSSLAITSYVHYQASLPDRNSTPTRSGNYLLRVFLNNDTTQIVFTKKLVVVQPLAQIATQVLQPFSGALFNTGQRLTLGVQLDKRINLLSQNDVKMVVMQNNNFTTASYLERPTIFRGNYLEYSDEAITAFTAGREFRWLDLRSLRLMSDRMQRLDSRKDSVQVFVKPETTRTGINAIFYRDLNGAYAIENYDNPNPAWQGDYAYTHFKYFPPGNRPMEGREVYIFGELSNWGADTLGRMHFNTESGAYEKTLLLKQGYYSYLYGTRPLSGPGIDFSQTEGNFFNTENEYTVLVYYRSFNSRADECVGYATFHSIGR